MSLFFDEYIENIDESQIFNGQYMILLFEDYFLLYRKRFNS